MSAPLLHYACLHCDIGYTGKSGERLYKSAEGHLILEHGARVKDIKSYPPHIFFCRHCEIEYMMDQFVGVDSLPRYDWVGAFATQHPCEVT